MIAGWAPVRLVEERLGVSFEDHHEATIGGVVLRAPGRLPDEGDEVELHGVRFRVLSAKDAQIHELQLVLDAGPRGSALAALDREPAVQQPARLAGRVGRVQQHHAELAPCPRRAVATKQRPAAAV